MDIKSVPINILVCDDDKGDIKILSTYFKLIAHEESTIYTATTNEEITSFIKNAKDNIDLIFLDYQMPVKSGLEWLKELSELNIAPVIMLTGRGDEKLAVEALQSGAADYIPKDNLNRYELSRAITGSLKRSEIEKERNALLGIAAHELRNPLTVIQGYVQMLGLYDSINEEKKKEILSVLEERSQYLLNIINKLLDISRIDKGIVQLKLNQVDIINFLEKKISHFKLYSKTKNICIELKTKLKVQKLKIDQDRIDEVISNIIDNAIKYSEPNTKITIDALINKNYFNIIIQDEGPGIKEDELKYLFNLFSNVSISSQPTGGEQSTGLGLAICKKITEQHGGTISVKSLVGEGSKFIVSLPIV